MENVERGLERSGKRFRRGSEIGLSEVLQRFGVLRILPRWRHTERFRVSVVYDLILAFSRMIFFRAWNLRRRSTRRMAKKMPNLKGTSPESPSEPPEDLSGNSVTSGSNLSGDSWWNLQVNLFWQILGPPYCTQLKGEVEFLCGPGHLTVMSGSVRVRHFFPTKGTTPEVKVAVVEAKYPTLRRLLGVE